MVELLGDHLLERKGTVPDKFLIDLLWSSIFIFKSPKEFNPFMFKAFYNLADFKREEPLSHSELLKIH